MNTLTSSYLYILKRTQPLNIEKACIHTKKNLQAFHYETFLISTSTRERQIERAQHQLRACARAGCILHIHIYQFHVHATMGHTQV